MKIEHIAIWTYQLEVLKAFYEKYFQAVAGARYTNAKKGFHSYFLSFESGCRLELMQMEGIPEHQNDVHAQFTGIIHIAFDAGSKAEVDRLTNLLRADGYGVVGTPRVTGDGYYESVILDPDKNRIEIAHAL